MAGGTFDKYVGKVRPGTYTNFVSGRQTGIVGGTRGICLIPLAKADYGPAKEYISLSAASPDAAMAKLGYSIYDEDENRQMLLIREAMKNAGIVIVYILAEGSKATATEGGLTMTAKYGGSRGNKYTVTSSENPLAGYDITIHLDGTKMAEYEGVETIEDLIALDSPYLDFSGSGDLSAFAGVNLEGGTDGTATNADYSDYIDSWEGVHFNTACLPTDEATLQAAALTKIKYMRTSMGKGVQVVTADYAGDHEGLINVTNAVSIDGDELTHCEACAWVTGATAGATYTDSLTYHTYDGATGLVDAKSHDEAIDAINKGEFFFSLNEQGEVVVEYDINSLVTYDNGKDESYRKNKVIRVFDTFQEDLQLNFPPNRFNNDEIGWSVMEGIGAGILLRYEADGAVQNVDTQTDFKVDKELSVGDSTYFDVLLQPVDSAEKLFFTVTTM